jgi:type IX secretion system PorP/SprF family membrane protein
MKKIILFLFSSFTLIVNAQQDPQYSMYMFNGQYLNPAYVGSKGVLDVSGIYRRQWAGFGDGAPQSANIGVHTPFKKEQYALGVLIGYDHIGLTDNYNLNAQFAYRIPVKKSTISLGIQSGFYHINDNRNNALRVDGGDPTFFSERRLWLPNVGTGVYVYSDRYYIGISMPHILNMSLSQRLSYSGTGDIVARQYRHYFATAGVVLGKETATVKYKPSVLIKYAQGQDRNIPDFDVNMSFLFVDRFWLGVSARTGGNRVGPHFSDIVGIFEMLVTQQLRVGYAYDYVLSNIGYHTHGSHEIMLGYQFGYQKKKFVNVRYGTYF